MWIPRPIWEHLEATLLGLQERNDRLTEALAQKDGGTRLALPQPKREPLPPRTLEKIPGYFDTKPIPVVPPNKTGGTTQ